jgi:hypothetical protein
VCEGEVETIIRESFENKLVVPNSRRFAAWATLLALIGQGRYWASELAEQSWPTDPSQQLAILSLPTAERAQSWVDSRDEVVIKGNPPHKAIHFIQRSLHAPPPTTCAVLRVEAMVVRKAWIRTVRARFLPLGIQFSPASD